MSHLLTGKTWIVATGIYALIALVHYSSVDTKSIYNGDGVGYYAYLPALINYAEIGFETVGKEEAKQGLHTHYRASHGSDVVNKSTLGVALLLTPFYLIGQLFGGPYDTGVQIMMILGALFYAALGFYFLTKILTRLKLSTLPILLVALGTNLLLYSVASPLMSHLYSFVLITIFMYYAHSFFTSAARRALVLTCLALGLVVLVRPVNGIVVLLLPFLFHISHSRWESIKPVLLKNFGVAALAGLAAPTLQMIYWSLHIGTPVLWSYGGEGFNWSDPHLWQIWFGFKKGLFIYTPLLLLAIIGLVMLIRKHGTSGWYLLGFFFVASYVISSWWNWYYGDSFGHRAFVDFLSILAIPLALVITYSLNKRKILVALAVMLSIHTMGQMYQYQHGIIHPNNMNFEKYVFSLYKFDDRFAGYFGGEWEPVPYGKTPREIKEETWKDIDVKGDEFPVGIEVSDANPLRIEVLVIKKEPQINFDGVWLVAHGMTNDKESVFYHTIPFYNIKVEGETTLEIGLNAGRADKVKFYVWNQSGRFFSMKEITFSVFALK